MDVLSGAFRIVKSHVVQDCGKSLNPQIDVGQAEGGFLFGVGYYMMEDLIYGPHGRLITDNVSGYKIPSCGDVPQEWDIELLNYPPGAKASTTPRESVSRTPNWDSRSISPRKTPCAPRASRRGSTQSSSWASRLRSIA